MIDRIPFPGGRATWSRRTLLSGLASLAVVRRAFPETSSFASFVASLWPEAERAGVSRAVFDSVARGLRPDPSTPKREASQPEFETPISVYLSHAAGPLRVARGRAEAQKWRPELAAIARRTGTPPEIMLAAWGMEADFTQPVQTHDVPRALATLAWTRPADSLYRTELFAAMHMIQDGVASRARLLGSWAGAMGMPQFMPSAYLRYAVSYRGKGPPDIWRSVPDALASIGNFFEKSGWRRGLRWGFEATIPPRFRWPTLRASFAEWRRLGLRRADAAALPEAGEATLFAPAGAAGPCFLLSDNYWVIKTYDNSDAYALSLALLGDAIAGRPALRRAWPRAAPELALADRVRMQNKLAALGFYRGASDGKVGPATRQAVHRFELSIGLQPADGLPTPRVLQALDAGSRLAR